MIICMCATKQWYIYQMTNLYALFKHNNVKKVYLFIDDDNIPYITDKRVEFVNVNTLKEYITQESPNYNTKYSKLSYLRCYFSKILKEDKILYLDADTLVVDNIEDLWNTDFNNNVLVGVHEGGEWNKHLWTYGLDDTYINSGVLLMNLKALREEKLDDSMIYLLNNNKYAFPDQDVINLVCRNRIKHVSNVYNSSETTGIVDNAKIIHYIRGNKGWIKGSLRSNIWFNYHNEYIEKEGIMDNYLVKAIKNFDDYGGKDILNPENAFIKREAGKSEWECSAERYEYLKSVGAVELVEIIKVEEPKEEKKPTKKTTKSKK